MKTRRNKNETKKKNRVLNICKTHRNNRCLMNWRVRRLVIIIIACKFTRLICFCSSSEINQSRYVQLFWETYVCCRDSDSRPKIGGNNIQSWWAYKINYQLFAFCFVSDFSIRLPLRTEKCSCLEGEKRTSGSVSRAVQFPIKSPAKSASAPSWKFPIEGVKVGRNRLFSSWLGRFSALIRLQLACSFAFWSMPNLRPSTSLGRLCWRWCESVTPRSIQFLGNFFYTQTDAPPHMVDNYSVFTRLFNSTLQKKDHVEGSWLSGTRQFFSSERRSRVRQGTISWTPTLLPRQHESKILLILHSFAPSIAFDKLNQFPCVWSFPGVRLRA